MLTYPEVLQTISTISGLGGVALAGYAAFFAHRVHGTVKELHETLKNQRREPGGTS